MSSVGFNPFGRVAVITGGARGLGFEFARRLVSEGAKVCISDIDVGVGEEAAEEIRKLYGVGKDRVYFSQCDVSSKDDWNKLWEEAETVLGGKVEILMNNAGVPPSAGMDISLKVMTIGATNGAMHALKRMRKSNGGDGGRIITTASCAGIVQTPLGGIDGAGYSISKFANVILTRMFPYYRPRPAEDGVKGYALAPWFTPTRMVLDEYKDSDDPMKSATQKISKISNDRLLVKEEVSEAMMEAFRRDKNGAIYVVYPDVPLIDVPDINMRFFQALVGTAKICSRLGVTTMSPKMFYGIIFFLIYLGIHVFDWIVCILCSIVF